MRVFTNGCFDLFHIGHLTTLRYCREWAGPDGKVLVGLNSDESVKRLKGVHRPIIPATERYEILSAIKYIDNVIIFEEDTPYELIKRIKPDILVKGVDYLNKEIVGAEFATKICFTPIIKSTTDILDKCKGKGYDKKLCL